MDGRAGRTEIPSESLFRSPSHPLARSGGASRMYASARVRGLGSHLDTEDRVSRTVAVQALGLDRIDSSMTSSSGSYHDHESEGTPVRLQKLLASAGYGSRRACEELISAGRVTIDDVVVRELGTSADPSCQKVRLDGELIRPQPRRYFLLNKPKGVLCTNRDPDNRPRAVDLFPEEIQAGLFSVGRLDENSEGLLLMTNDGDLANRLAHPRYQVSRTYQVHVAGKPESAALDSLKQGMRFSDGFFRVDGIRRVGRKGNSTILDVSLKHGQNREIRRLFARIGHKVMTLQRLRFGPLSLGNVKSGRYRPLTKAEIDQLQAFVSGRSSSKKSGTRSAKSPTVGSGPVASRPPRKKAARPDQPRVAGQKTPRSGESQAKGRGARKGTAQSQTKRPNHTKKRGRSR